MTTLLNNLPSELINIIETYKIPLKCDRCKKISFEILFCIRNDNHKICHNCAFKCSLCDAFISDTNRINEYSGCNDSHGCFVGSSKSIKMSNREEYYCPGIECHLCKQMICYKCFVIADDFYGKYYCKQCINKCLQCDQIILDLKITYGPISKYYDCDQCNKCIVQYVRTVVNGYQRFL